MKLYTLAQAAEIMGITPDSLRQRVNRGTLKAQKLGKTWLITQKQLQELCPHEHTSTPGDITTNQCAYCGMKLYLSPTKGKEV